MSDEEREKAAACPVAEHGHEHHLPHEHGADRQAHHLNDHDHGVAGKHRKHEQQPGGGRYSDSEKPDSGKSRWGGGRGIT
jgi:hypothetical protein